MRTGFSSWVIHCFIFFLRRHFQSTSPWQLWVQWWHSSGYYLTFPFLFMDAVFPSWLWWKFRSHLWELATVQEATDGSYCTVWGVSLLVPQETFIRWCGNSALLDINTCMTIQLKWQFLSFKVSVSGSLVPYFPENCALGKTLHRHPNINNALK